MLLKKAFRNCLFDREQRSKVLKEAYCFYFRWRGIKLFPGNLSSFRIFSGFSSNLQISVDWMIVYWSNMIWKCSFPEIYPVSRFFPGFSGFNSNLQILVDWMIVYWSNMIFFSFREIYLISRFYRALFKSSDLDGFNHISSNNLFIKYDIIIFFSGIYPVFGFSVFLILRKFLYFIDFDQN